MKIYLDIDETILKNDLILTNDGYIYNGGPVKHLKPFLQYILNKHDVYWLTTHCNGDASIPVNYLSRYFSQELLDLIIRIKPTKWKQFKVEAIDLREDFLWFDDYVTQYEQKILQKANKSHCHIQVNLDDNPEYLLDFMDF